MRFIKVLTLLSVATFALSPQQAQAQVITSDPTNLIQNTTSAIAEVNSTVQQIRSVALQVQQLQNELRNLKKLDPQNLIELQMSLNQVQGLINRTKGTARQWDAMGQRFDQVYGKYAPAQYKGAPYRKLRDQWRTNTDKAQEDAVRNQAHVAELHVDIADKSKTLEQQAQDVEGALEAAQVTAEILAVMMRQQQLQAEMIMHQHHMQQMMLLQEKLEREAAQKRAKAAMGGGMGEFKSTAKPVKLPELQ